MGSSTLPEARYGQAVAFDETRGVLVVFGGIADNPSTGQAALQDVWEWDPAAGAWELRPSTGTAPSARSGAAMAYDSTRKQMVLFGGRAGSGYDLQDTWEWDPATGAWTDKNGAGPSPSARSQHGMIFDSKNGKVVLFGGGRSTLGGDPMSLYVSFADTWEYDGTKWAQRTTTTAPTTRAAFGFAYSSETSKAYLFGGTEIPTPNAPATLKQDIWEYDGGTGAWAERTAVGSKPSARFGHSMTIDSVNGLAVVFGGFDIGTSGSMNDLWTWNLASGTWQAHDPASGALWPGRRKWATLVMGASATRAFLVAGAPSDSGGGYDAGVPWSSGTSNASREVWELNPSTTTWVNRSAPNDNPGSRVEFAMTSDLVTGKVYLFGGLDPTGNTMNDLWEWNGTKWVECTGDLKPPARSDAAMSYDPVRNSLILFGGNMLSYYTGYGQLGDTWEWNTTTRKWIQLSPAVSPGARSQHAMVTDTTRQKIVLFGGQNMTPIPYYPDAGVRLPTYEVWEWDGTASIWTDRSPVILGEYPSIGSPPAVVYDEGSKKVAMFGYNYNFPGEANVRYWDWDSDSGAFSPHVTNDSVALSQFSVAYDSIRRRTIAVGPMNAMMSSPSMSTCELDNASSTWYVRTLTPSPASRWADGMAFDRQRGVVVLYGGRDQMSGAPLDDTWEYRVGGWGNGTGCTAAFAAQCASGNCVDGVCCESASCTGACKSCNVAGKAGTCVLAAPGTQVAGSCIGDQACDPTGACKTSNGKACTSAAVCASGFCADGVCCDSACTGECVSCNQTGKVGSCTPFVAGTDPQKECSAGSPPCQSTCDGVGSCIYPSGLSCGSCGYCNGAGTCQEQWYCATNTGVGTSTSITPWPDGGWPIYTGTGTAIRTLPITGTVIATGTGTGMGTGSIVTTSTRTDRGTATATLSLATLTATGTNTLSTAATTGTRTSASTDTGTSSPTATGAGTASTGNITSVGTSISTKLPTATQTDVGTGSTANRTGTATDGSSTRTTSNTSTNTQAIRDAGAGDGGSPKLGNGGCSCDLGARTTGGPTSTGWLGLLGALLFLSRSRRRRR